MRQNGLKRAHRSILAGRRRQNGNKIRKLFLLFEKQPNAPPPPEMYINININMSMDMTINIYMYIFINIFCKKCFKLFQTVS